MYRYENRQILLTDFRQPNGMRLKEDNRWVVKAEIIPWFELEKKYAALFKNRNGNVAKPFRLALGALIIQAEYGYSDVETAYQIQENPYLQFFCGYREYDDTKLPFDPSLMVHFRKRLNSEILGEINEIIIQETIKRENKSKDKDDNDDQNNDDTSSSAGDADITDSTADVTNTTNAGTLIVDATCAPSNIQYPQDVKLLTITREKAEELVDILHDQRPKGTKKPRTNRVKAKKESLAYLKSKSKRAKETRKAIKSQLQYIKRDLGYIETMLALGLTLEEKHLKNLETAKAIYEQQKYMYDNKTHRVENRIVSFDQPYIRPIVRGKASKKVEFGAKLDISVANGWTRLECWSFDAYNESTKLVTAIERYKDREGHYPERVLADKIYRNRENLKYCKERNIRLSGPALGRPKKDEVRDKKQISIDQNDRIEVERKFSEAKRKCNLGLVTTKLESTIEFTIAMSIVMLNLRKIQRALFFTFLDFFTLLGVKNIDFYTPLVSSKKVGVVQ